MVSLRAIGISMLAACSLTPALAALTPAQIVTNIKTLTQKSLALQAPAQSITFTDGPLILIGQGPFPKLILGFTDIVATATTAISQMQGDPVLPAGPEADSIFDAFREFVRVHQVLLNILIGKAGIFNTVPYIGQPVAAVLRSIESVVDTAAFALINTVQSRSADLKVQADSLHGTVAVAITRYERLSTADAPFGAPISRVKRGTVEVAA